MLSNPPSTGDVNLDNFLRSVKRHIDDALRPKDGWRLSDFSADVSEVISDKRDLIDIVTRYDDINAVKDSVDLLLADYAEAIADQKAIGEQYEDHAEVFTHTMEWWNQNRRIIEDAAQAMAATIQASDYADEAEASAVRAGNHEDGASQARDAAVTAKNQAATSATQAATSATNAASSADDAATSEDTSLDAAAAAIAAAVSVAQFQGHGFPNGKVSAPVGSIYTDLDATNGAIRWIKTSGTGNTGWKVEYGDTGWRVITAWDSDGSLVGTLPNGMLAQEDKSGGMYYRRVNGTVTLSIVSAVAVRGNLEIPIPPGFAPGRSPYPTTAISLTGINNRAYGLVGNSYMYASVVGASVNSPVYLPSTNPSYSSDATWGVDTAWPSTLPGTPA